MENYFVFCPNHLGGLSAFIDWQTQVLRLFPINIFGGSLPKIEGNTGSKFKRERPGEMDGEGESGPEAVCIGTMSGGGWDWPVVQNPAGGSFKTASRS